MNKDNSSFPLNAGVSYYMPASQPSFLVDWGHVGQVASVILGATAQALDAWNSPAPLDIADLDEDGSTRLTYLPQAQRYEVSFDPILTEPVVSPSARDLLKELEAKQAKPVVAKPRPRQNRSPFWHLATQEVNAQRPAASPRLLETIDQTAPETPQRSFLGTSTPSRHQASQNVAQQARQYAENQQHLAYAQQPVRLVKQGLAVPDNRPVETINRLFSSFAQSPKIPSPVAASSLPKADYKGKDLWQKLELGHALSDKEVKQLFHSLELATYEGASELASELAKAYAKEQVVRNAQNELAADDNGMTTLQGVPVRVEDAGYFLHQDLEHFIETGEHLSPDQLLVESGSVSLQYSKLPKYRGKESEARVRDILKLTGINNYPVSSYPLTLNEPLAKYPDVTENQKRYITAIEKEVKTRPETASLFITRFGKYFATNGKWDLKGQPGIPPSGKGGKPYWAKYKGQKVHDAYLANHAYGYAMAAYGYDLSQTLLIAGAIAGIGQESRENFLGNDQLEDQVAIISGWFELYTGNPWPQGLDTMESLYNLKSTNPQEYQKREKNVPVYYSKIMDKALKLYQPSIVEEKWWDPQQEALDDIMRRSQKSNYPRKSK